MHKVVDLFAGAGLLSEGFQQAGFTVVRAIDVDAKAVANYNRNVGAHAIAGSVKAIEAGVRADVVVAGPPCQGFSTLGRRDPRDARNELCLVVPKWARSCRASVAIVENVPAFLSSSHWRKMCREFEKLGFEIDTWELDANDYGVAQHRRRSFTVASRIGQIRKPNRRNQGLTVRDAFRGIASSRVKTDSMHRWCAPSPIASRRIALVPARGDKRDILRVRPDLCPASWKTVGCAATDVWGRMAMDEPANTLRCTFLNPSKGRYLHPTENRTISLREGARLQGIPDHWEMQGEPYVVARQIGNGVPVPLAAAVAGSVFRAFG